MKKKIIINNLQELEDFANKVAKCLKGDELLLLEGNLAAGKTTFTKYIAKNFGIDDYEVVSPTFNIMNIYEGRQFDIYHIDLYRVDDFDITDFIGKGLIIIEWPKEDYTKYTKKQIKLSFNVLDNERREITIETDLDIEDCLNM